ncbi:ParB N-terminal domain-containing protein [Azospirillum sp. RWY-5-1]|uniref:ParB N-terminal domain-containing protein n=1 Tax=Azospirillum oleiclasticum TaxID=2735135 RepID=A0ABX2TM20_9PROT|nr:ParB N-terminal domain-containing protein [Azospirillum oleiclasticum]NYZ17040.1 ParB N-terminal domain-containing protein [Azospirillum oleiclasticum]NYZ24516.1 ParB N-terminal domain-containing protein [Azospirillum oleiclasticum]
MPDAVLADYHAAPVAAPADAFAGLGPRPTLAWIDVELLTVDPRYQRSTDSRASRDNIQRIVERFSWRKFQVLTVVATGDLYAIIDGQHRWEAAKLHPAVPSVPCMILPEAGLAEDARTFTAINLDRVAVNPFHLHKARLAAGDPDALHLQEVCDRSGIVIPRTNLTPKDLPPRATLALGTIRDCLVNFGDGPTVAALSVLADAFPREPGAVRASLIKAMVQLFVVAKAAGRDAPEIDRARLAKVLASRGAVPLEKAGRAYKDNFGGTSATAIRAAVARAYNERLPAERRLPETV